MNQIIDVLSAIVVVGGILVLSRPGSQGPALIQNLSSGFSNALGTAVGAPGTSMQYAA
jgi:hypothetical protein